MKIKTISGKKIKVEDTTMTNTVTVENNKKMTFEEKSKTAKGAFGLNLFCAVCWSFVDCDPGKKSDIFLLVLDTFLVVFYLVSSLISYRKMINEKDENKSNSVIV